MKLLSYNIRFGGAGREEHIAAVIRGCDPDLVVLQEATRPEVVRRVAERAGFEVWGARQGHSLAFLSRAEVARHDWHWPRGAKRAFLELSAGGGALRVYGLHLSAVHSYWTERRRVREIRALLNYVAAQPAGPHVLVGDFNTLAPGEPLDTRRLPPRLRPLVWLSAGRIRWETIQITLDAGYADGYRLLNPSDKGYTFPTWDPHVRLDYLFLPAPFAATLRECRVVREHAAVRDASDHFPLLAHIEAGS